jgi:hypothetical protein
MPIHLTISVSEGARHKIREPRPRRVRSDDHAPAGTEATKHVTFRLAHLRS